MARVLKPRAVVLFAAAAFSLLPSRRSAVGTGVALKHQPGSK